ncbi:MAG: hypothetical protein HKN12_09490 [Gemmatimonadetes bacterium]|nr:hypothetical protein [Gemmatimonadota bacterium]
MRTLLRPLLAAILLSGCAEAPPPTVQEVAQPGPVFLLGFDGLEPGLVARYEADGTMPNFVRLRERGAVGVVRSTVPFISPPAWTTVATGVTPGDHGVWSFWLPEGDNPRGRYVDATARLAEPVWKDLSAAGRTVGIVNVPVTSPPDSVNGFLISGFPYPAGAPLTFPPELEADIRKRGYLPDEYGGAPVPGEEEAWLDHVEAIAHGRRDVALDLLFKEKPDLSVIVFTSPDRIQHHLWKFHDAKHPLHDASAAPRLKNAVRDSYAWCDDVLGEVLDRLPKNAVLFVVSDHGFGPAYQGISKARVLAELGVTLPVDVGSRNIFGGDFWLGDVDEDTRAAFGAGLAELRGSDGRPLVGKVFDTRDEYARVGHGRALGPDFVAEEADGYVFTPGRDANDPLTGTMPPRSFSGYHRRLGYFGAWGPPIVNGPVRDIDLSDLPAMSLHILGEKIPRRYYHNIPRRLFPPTYFVERPMLFDGEPLVGFRRPEDRPDVAPDPGMVEQLEAMGYLGGQ